MRANRAYRLIADHQPALLADPARVDRIEVVSVDDGEIVLYWNLPPREAARLLRALRADLAGMDEEEFMQTWEGADEDGEPDEQQDG